MRFASVMTIGALMALASCGTTGGKDTDTTAAGDADTDTDADTETGTSDTGGGSGGGSDFDGAGFALEIGVDANGNIVPVNFPGYTATYPDGYGPYFEVTAYDTTGYPMCTIYYKITNPTISNWSADDYFSWEVAGADLVVDYDGCSGYAVTTSYGYALEDFAPYFLWQFSIGPLSDYIGGYLPASYDTSNLGGGKIGGDVFGGDSSDYFITSGYEVDDSMNLVLDADGYGTPIPAGEIPLGAGVKPGFYNQFSIFYFGL